MKVIGIDPGYDRMGVAIIERIDVADKLLYSTCVTTDKKQPFPARLATIGNTLSALIEQYEPELLGIETLFFNKNVKTAIDVAQARGTVIYLAQTHSCAIMELSPQQVKVATTGHGASDKVAVQAMVKRLISDVPDQAHDDEYDAIAVGITALAHYR